MSAVKYNGQMRCRKTWAQAGSDEKPSTVAGASVADEHREEDFADVRSSIVPEVG